MGHGIFGGVKGAKPMLDATYFTPGTYWCRIDRCKVDVNRKKRKFCANEFTILKVVDSADGKALRVGQTPSDIMMVDSDYFEREINGFVGNTMGLDPDMITEEHCEAIYGDDQPLAGTIVEMTARNIVTQEGKDYTRISYIREVTAAEALAGLDQATIDRFFPNGSLQAMAEAEAEAA